MAGFAGASSLFAVRRRRLGVGFIALCLCFRIEHCFRGGSSSGRILFSLRPPHCHIFATRNALRFVSAARDRDGDGNFDFRVKRQRHLVLPDRLDRRIEHDLRTADLGTIGREQACDVARRNRAE